MRDFTQNHWQTLNKMDYLHLLDIALFEDTEMPGDLTSLALVPENAHGTAAVTARENGILAGIPLVTQVLARFNSALNWDPLLDDSAELSADTVVGIISGSVRDLMQAERPILNFLAQLSGIATVTQRYVNAVSGTQAQIYDTRKTTPGWRRLEKYAVVCGGGKNHRTGLFDAILIKDNHLAFGQHGNQPFSPADAVHQAKVFLQERYTEIPIVEIEVDTLEQLREVLFAQPDIVLLDNMTPAQIAEAVQIRNSIDSNVQLEASGGVTLETVRQIAETGVERISVGALTHAADSLDFGLDWKT